MKQWYSAENAAQEKGRREYLWLAISLLIPALTFAGSVSFLPWKIALLAQTAAIGLGFGLHLAAQTGLLPPLDSRAQRLLEMVQERIARRG